MKNLTPEALAEFVTQAIPRNVARDYVLRGSKLGARFLVMFGLFFLLIGGILTFFMLPPRILDAIRMNNGELGRTQGTIDACEDTMFNEGSSKHSSSRPVLRLDFSFESSDGTILTGHSFVTNQRREPGSAAEIEYLISDPSLVRVAGTRLNPLGLLTCLVLIFPAIGAGVLFFPWRGRRRRLRLLRNGSFAFAEIIEIQSTNLVINNEPVFKVTTRIEDDGPPIEITSSVRGRDADLAQERLAKNERIGILYDPKRPKRALFTANLMQSR